MDNPDRPSGLSTHIPIAILALALAAYFAMELRSSSKQAEIMKWQLDNLDKQTENLKEAQKQLGDLITKQDSTVKQAEQIQARYVDLFKDLLELAKEDKDAKEVVDQWKIQMNEPAPEAKPADEKEKKE
jgi:CHASE3 domain sensor protein